MIASFTRRSILVSISILVLLISSFLSSFSSLQKRWPALSKSFESSEIIRFDASLSSLMDMRPEDGVLGFVTDIFPDNETARDLIQSDSFLRAFRDYLKTGAVVEEMKTHIHFNGGLSNRVRDKYRFFVFAQFSLAPNILVTRSFNFLDEMRMHQVDFQWDAGEYPNLVIGHQSSKAYQSKNEGLDEHRIWRDLGNGFVLYKRDP